VVTALGGQQGRAVTFHNMQGNAKGRLMTHLSEMKRLANGGKKSDLFAAHFVGHISEEKKLTTISKLSKGDDGSRYSMARRWNQMHEIIWKGSMQSMHEGKN